MNANNNDHTLTDHAGEAADKLEQQREDALEEICTKIVDDGSIEISGHEYNSDDLLFGDLSMTDAHLDDYIASQKESF